MKAKRTHESEALNQAAQAEAKLEAARKAKAEYDREQVLHLRRRIIQEVNTPDSSREELLAIAEILGIDPNLPPAHVTERERQRRADLEEAQRLERKADELRARASV